MSGKNHQQQIPVLCAQWADNTAGLAARLAEAERHLAGKMESNGIQVENDYFTPGDIKRITRYLTTESDRYTVAFSSCAFCPELATSLAVVRCLNADERKTATNLPQTTRFIKGDRRNPPNRQTLIDALSRLGPTTIYGPNHPVLSLVEQGICRPHDSASLRQTAVIEEFLFVPSCDGYPQNPEAHGLLGFILQELSEGNRGYVYDPDDNKNFHRVLAVKPEVRQAIDPMLRKWSGTTEYTTRNSSGGKVKYLSWNLAGRPHRQCPVRWTQQDQLKA